MHAPPRPPAAFSLIELLVALAVVALLVALALPSLHAARQQARAGACLSNIRQIATGFTLYADDHRGALPTELDAPAWDALLRPYLGDASDLRCPGDPLDTPLSYDWRQPYALTFLIPAASSLADRNLHTLRRTDVVLAFEQAPGWHLPDQLHAATVDTASRAWSFADLEAHLLEPID